MHFSPMRFLSDIGPTFISCRSHVSPYSNHLCVFFDFPHNLVFVPTQVTCKILHTLPLCLASLTSWHFLCIHIYTANLLCFLTCLFTLHVVWDDDRKWNISNSVHLVSAIPLVSIFILQPCDSHLFLTSGPACTTHTRQQTEESGRRQLSSSLLDYSM